MAENPSEDTENFTRTEEGTQGHVENDLNYADANSVLDDQDKNEGDGGENQADAGEGGDADGGEGEEVNGEGSESRKGGKALGRGNNRGKMNNNRKKKPLTRLFVGNLKSEVVTKKDFRDIWEKYGVVTEVAIHRSFGFVQFAKTEDMEAAIKGEQGRMIGGKPIDLQVAKNDSRRGPPEKGRPTPNQKDRRQRKPEQGGRDRVGREDRGRARNNDNRRSRSRSPRRDRRGDDRGQRGRRDSRDDKGYRPGPSPRDVLPPLNGAVVSLILLGEQQRAFAETACESIRQVGIPYEIVMLDGRTLGQALRDAEENRSRYALIVGRDNAKKQQITVKMIHLRDAGRCPTFDLRIPELVEKIVRAERDLGFLEAGMPPQADTSQLQTGLLGLSHLFDSSATSFAPTTFLPGAQNQVSSLASLLQKVQSQPIMPAPAPTVPLNPSLSSVAQQLQQLQQQLQQISPEQRHQLFAYQNPGMPLVGDSESAHVAHAYPPQYAPHPGYSVIPDSQKSLVGSGQMSVSDIMSDPQKHQISELSRLLNSLQQKNKGQ